MSTPSSPADSVVLYLPFRIRVQLDNREVADPREALEEAIAQLLPAAASMKVPGQPAGTEDGEWDEAVLGGLVDYQDDEDFEASTYVSDGQAVNYMSGDTMEVLRAILAAGAKPPSLEHLRAVARGPETLLAQEAMKGLLQRADLPADERTQLFARMAENPHACRACLAQHPEILQYLTPDMLEPLFTSEDSAVRRLAIDLTGRIQAARQEPTSDRRSGRGR